MLRRMRLLACVLFSVAVIGCGPSSSGNGPHPDAKGSGGVDAPPGTADADPNQPDAPIGGNNFTVYAHSDHTLYKIDLGQKTLQTIGAFKAPQVMVGGNLVEDVITDLAVAPNNTIYVISETQLYTADPSDGHVTLVGKTSACGTKTVALTTTPDGRIWAGDYSGAICQVDITVSPPVVKAPVTMKGGYALSGDMVAIDTGTVFGTAYLTGTSPAAVATQKNNLLVTVDVTTGDVTVLGTGTGFPKLYGAAFAGGQVFGFTHDGTGHVVTIDRTSGVGTLYATFTDPTTSPPKGISFAGAGVNSLVVIN
jgi:hypothetical protein